MPTRRSHRKSQKGCVICKRHHVKCDEDGPPCGRCKLRGAACVYTSTSSSQQVSTPPSYIAADSAQNSERRNTPVFPADNRRLELQLMHRWSTMTYKSCCTPGSDDDEVWQFLVPELALQYDFLLNGVFALSAFETARSLRGKPDYEQYVNAAIEYHASALSSFRSQLPAILRDGHEAALCFSLMLMVLALASVQFPSASAGDNHGGGMVQSAIIHFELLRGCVPVAESKEGYLAENPYISKMTRFEDLPRATLDGRIEEALAKLSELNDRRIASSVRESDERRVQQVDYWEACKKALGLLRECFEKCTDGLYQGYSLGWLNMAGEGYIKAIKEDDHTALLMLMYWGLLVERIGHHVWWAEQFGNLLVDEISDRVLGSDTDATMKDIVQQAREMIQAVSGEGAES